MDGDDSFIGSGISFPLRLDARGAIALSSREDEIDEAVRLILGTSFGERPMRPEFGCGIHDYVFAPADSITQGMIAHEVFVALERWEPRIEVTEVNVHVVPEETSQLLIDITYEIRGVNDPRNLVFPFYTLGE